MGGHVRQGGKPRLNICNCCKRSFTLQGKLTLFREIVWVPLTVFFLFIFTFFIWHKNCISFSSIWRLSKIKMNCRCDFKKPYNLKMILSHSQWYTLTDQYFFFVASEVLEKSSLKTTKFLRKFIDITFMDKSHLESMPW